MYMLYMYMHMYNVHVLIRQDRLHGPTRLTHASGRRPAGRGRTPLSAADLSGGARGHGDRVDHAGGVSEMASEAVAVADDGEADIGERGE